MSKSKIEWTDRVWNPVRGCARVSPGCENCYAERQAHRFSGPGGKYEGLTVLGKHGPRWAGHARFVPEMLDAPLRWKAPSLVFVNSMSDLFHEDVSFEQIAAVFGVMAACPQHTFQVLTKRPERARKWFEWLYATHYRHERHAVHEYARRVLGSVMNERKIAKVATEWPLPNVWFGVSCEDQKRMDERAPILMECPAAVHFISAEPLLEDIYMSKWFAIAKGSPRIDWVIVGGESGPGARPCYTAWVESIVQQCALLDVACFVKQLGLYVVDNVGMNDVIVSPPVVRGRLLDDGTCERTTKSVDGKGGDPIAWPAHLRVRQYPKAFERSAAFMGGM